MAGAFGGDEKRLTIGMGQAMKDKWIALKKEGAEQLLSRKEASVVDVTSAQLQRVQKGDTVDEKDLATLKRRQLLTAAKVAVFTIGKGSKWSKDKWNVKEAAELTHAMLLSGAWKTTPFKSYNFNALGAATEARPPSPPSPSPSSLSPSPLLGRSPPPAAQGAR